MFPNPFIDQSIFSCHCSQISDFRIILGPSLALCSVPQISLPFAVLLWAEQCPSGTCAIAPPDLPSRMELLGKTYCVHPQCHSCQIVLQGACSILYSYQQYISFYFSTFLQIKLRFSNSIIEFWERIWLISLHHAGS